MISIELHDKYVGVHAYTNRTYMSRQQEYFGEDMVQMYIKGCASLMCFREHLPDYLDLVRLGEDDHDDTAFLTILHTEIIKACKDIHQMHDYDLS